MDDREEKLRAGKEMLKRFQASKRSFQNATPSPPPDMSSTSAAATATSFRISQAPSGRPSEYVMQQQPQSGTISDYFSGGSNGPAFNTVAHIWDENYERPLEIVPQEDNDDADAVGGALQSSGHHRAEEQGSFGSTAVELNPLQVLSHDISGVLSAEENSVTGNAQLAHLERKNRELEEQVQAQKATLHQYEAQILSRTSQLQKAQAALEQEREEKEQLHFHETTKTNDELTSHRESIQMLVSEKSDGEITLKRVESALRAKEAEVLALELKLEEVSSKVCKQVSELHDRTSLYEEKSTHGKEMLSLQKQLAEKQTLLNDQKHDISELRQKLTFKEQENHALTEELTKKISRLEMAELNLTQLRSVSSLNTPENDGASLKEKDSEIATLKSRQEELVKREAELTAYIQQASHDREQIIHQYTTYCKQLTGQIEAITLQLNDKLQEVSTLSARESELVSHIEQLEGQLQKLIQGNYERQRQTANVDLDRKELDMMRKQLAELDAKLSEVLLERDNWQGKCHEKDEELHVVKMTLVRNEAAMSDLETRNEMLKGATSGIKSQDLVAACESDKVAASRAMAQNKQLKEQLVELETAVISLTNAKADLANELDTLRRRRDQSSESETARQLEVTALQGAVRERDRTILQMKEQMKHYVAFAENSISGRIVRGDEESEEVVTDLRVQLEGAKEEIRCLSSQNSELRGQLEVLSSSTRETSGSPREATTPAMSTMSEDSLSGTSSRLSSPAVEEEEERQQQRHHGYINGDPVAAAGKRHEPENRKTSMKTRHMFSVPVISHDVAFVKLEQKFFEAMNRIAELLQEKEHLEHLTVQLQEETETVGEYITIYQYQRQQIKQRMEEKESQLQTVSREREELKSKLSQLHALLAQYLGEKVPRRMDGQGNLENGAYEVAQEATPENITSDDLDENSAPASRPQSQTADKILALLSEIGANQMFHEDFHPWFWEQSSGRLMTV